MQLNYIKVQNCVFALNKPQFTAPKRHLYHYTKSAEFLVKLVPGGFFSRNFCKTLNNFERSTSNARWLQVVDFHTWNNKDLLKVGYWKLSSISGSRITLFVSVTPCLPSELQQLTEEELSHLQQPPLIGSDALAGICFVSLSLWNRQWQLLSSREEKTGALSQVWVYFKICVGMTIG